MGGVLAAEARGALTGLRRVCTVLRCRTTRLVLGLLRFLFGFDRWHVSAPYPCRPYKRQVVELVNSLRPTTVVEIGCGLGDIVSRVSAVERFGIDIDPRVIRAARFLHPLRARWIHGDGSAVEGLVPTERGVDCVIMVNWIHNLSPDELASVLRPLLPLARFLVLDAIDPDGPESYRFKHDFSFLSGTARRISVTHAVNEPRRFVLLQVAR